MNFAVNILLTRFFRIIYIFIKKIKIVVAVKGIFGN